MTTPDQEQQRDQRSVRTDHRTVTTIPLRR
jgi:hypothetical protein